MFKNFLFFAKMLHKIVGNRNFLRLNQDLSELLGKILTQLTEVYLSYDDKSGVIYDEPVIMVVDIF